MKPVLLDQKLAGKCILSWEDSASRRLQLRQRDSEIIRLPIAGEWGAQEILGIAGSPTSSDGDAAKV